MFCRSSSRSRTQLSHTARVMERSAQRPFSWLPLPPSPGLQDTDLHTSCCLGRLPRGSHTHACRHHTASPSVRWSKCIPPCVGRRSPLCTRTLPSLRTGKCPWHHFVLSPPQRGRSSFIPAVQLHLCLPTCHCWGFPCAHSNMHRTPDSSQLFSTFNNSTSTHATNALSHSCTCRTQPPGSRTHLYSRSR